VLHVCVWGGGTQQLSEHGYDPEGMALVLKVDGWWLSAGLQLLLGDPVTALPLVR
jgi:hypothetical protein